jgi:streptogramin lyase
MYEWLPHNVELLTDTSSAHWVVSRLAPWGHDGVRVASFMPNGFEAYARVFHPAGERGGPSGGLKWSEVAARLSKRFHPEVQFQELAGPHAEQHPVLGDIEPLSGSLPLTLLRSMVGFLERWTDEGELCWFAMWDGNGTWWKGAHSTLTSDGPRHDLLDDERDAVLRSTPRVHTQHRDYFLMRGPLASAVSLHDAAGSQSPALWWPDSRAWLVSTEVDAFSTYIGGPTALIDELLRSVEIEAVPISLDAPLDGAFRRADEFSPLGEFVNVNDEPGSKGNEFWLLAPALRAPRLPLFDRISSPSGKGGKENRASSNYVTLAREMRSTESRSRKTQFGCESIAVATALIALVSCTADTAPKSADSDAEVQLQTLPVEVASACAYAYQDAADSFPVLCPRRLPRASDSSVPGNPPAPLRAAVIRDERGRAHGLEFSYSAPDERHPERNHPNRFLHFALLGEGSGFATPMNEWEELGDAEFGSRKGRLYSVSVSSYHKNHLVFSWREDEARLVASLHSWGREETLHLLDRLVSGLQSRGDVEPHTRPVGRVMTTRIGNYGATKVAVGSNSVWAIGYTQGKLFPLDPETGVRSDLPIDVGRYPTDLVLRNGTMWVSRHDDSGSENKGDVLRISLGDGATDRLSAGVSPNGIAIANDRVWVIDFVDDTLRALEARSGEVAVGPIDLGGAMVAAASFRGHVVIVDAGRSQVLWFDAVSGEAVRRKSLDDSLGGMAVADGSIWVTDRGNRRLVRIDATTGEVTKTITLPGMPGRVAATDRSVWVTDYWGGHLIRISTRTNRVEDQIYVGGHPFEVTVGAEAVWVVNDGTIQRVDVQEWQGWLPAH